MLELSLVNIGKMLFYISIAPLIVYSLKYYSFAFASIFSKKKPSPPDMQDIPGSLSTSLSTMTLWWWNA